MKDTNGENEKQFFDYDEFLAAKEGDEPITFPLPLITRPAREDLRIAVEQILEPAAEEEEESPLAKQLKAVLKQHGLVAEENLPEINSTEMPPEAPVAAAENTDVSTDSNPEEISAVVTAEDSARETISEPEPVTEAEGKPEEKVEAPTEATASEDPKAEPEKTSEGPGTENPDSTTQGQYLSKRAKKAAKRRERRKIMEQSADNAPSEKASEVEEAAAKLPHGHHISMEDSLLAAFENPGEDSVESDSDDTPTEGVSQNVSQRSVKRKTYFAIGIAVCFLSLVGLFFCGSAFFSWMGDIINNTAQKEDFKDFLYPIIITDPPASESVTHLPTDTLVSAAIWDIILNGDVEKYPSEFGSITVPQVDVEIHANKLFGPDARLQHKTIGDPSLAFYYNADTNSYLIPSEPQYFAYSPYVENIRREGDIYRLRVGYISPHPDWMEVPTDKKGNPLADKYMEYTLMKNGNGYIVISIKETPGGVGDGGVNVEAAA